MSLVVTQGDKPKGRGHQLAFPPVKEYALANHLPVFQPVSLKSEEAYQRLAQEKPDLIVVTAYGKILPQKVLDLPPYGCINIHASLLPRYRGAAPIQWAVINGETESGVTSMQMAAGLDTGDMLLRRSREIPPEMTAGELHDLLAQDGAAVLAQTLRELETGKLRPEKQDDALSTYAPMLTKDLGRMDWTKPASRASQPDTGAEPVALGNGALRGKRLENPQNQSNRRRQQPCGARNGVVPGSLDSSLRAGRPHLGRGTVRGCQTNDCGGVSTRPSHDGGIGDGIE